MRPHAPPPLPSAAVPHSDSRAASTDMLPHRLRQQRQPQREELKRQALSWQQVGLGLLQDAPGDVRRGPLLVLRQGQGSGLLPLEHQEQLRSHHLTLSDGSSSSGPEGEGGPACVGACRKGGAAAAAAAAGAPGLPLHASAGWSTSSTSCNHERGRTPPQLESEQSATLSPPPVTLSHPTQLVRRRVVMGHAGRVAGAEPGQRSAFWVVRRAWGSRGAGASASDAGPPGIEAAAGSGGDNRSSAPHLAAGNGVGSAAHTPALKLQRQRAYATRQQQRRQQQQQQQRGQELGQLRPAEPGADSSPPPHPSCDPLHCPSSHPAPPPGSPPFTPSLPGCTAQGQDQGRGPPSPPAAHAASSPLSVPAEEWLPEARARVAMVVPRDQASPYRTTWGEVVQHIAQRLTWTDPTFEMRVFWEEDLGRPGVEGDQAWQQLLGALGSGRGAQLLLVAGPADPHVAVRFRQVAAAGQLPATRLFMPAGTGAAGARAGSELGGGWAGTTTAAGSPWLQLAAQLPFTTAAKTQQLWATLQDLWSRHTSDDLLFVVLVLINQYVMPVKQVYMSSKGIDGPSLSCMVRNCGRQILGCVTNPTCKAGLDCLQACGFNDQVCQYRCIVSYETPQFEAFALCILQKHNCRSLSAEMPMRPDPAPLASFRGQPLTHSQAELRARRGHSDGVWKANRPAGTTNRFQSEWLEGREMWLVDFGLQGNLYRLRCIACDLVLNSHLHTIQKHEDSARHKQNLAAKQKSSAAVQAFKAALTTAAAKRKEQMEDPATVTQFAAEFYLLKLGRPMTDIEHTPDLLRVARTPAIAAKHWKDDNAWQIAEALYSVMRKHDLEVMQSATFLSLSLDEATIVPSCVSMAMCPGMGISQLWQSLSKQPITALEISEYGKLAELAMVMFPGSVEEERMFSAMAYLKDDTRKRLIEEHLNVCARAFHTVTHGVSDFPYHEAIGDIFVAWLDPGQSGAGSGTQQLPFSWLVAAGKNPAYDFFPAQHQLFYRGRGAGVMWYEPVFKAGPAAPPAARPGHSALTLDGREVWRRRRYRVRRGSTPGTFFFTVLDNGVTSNEYWRILDCDEDFGWALFYYSGAASAAGLSYSGAVLGTRDGAMPTGADVLRRLEAALELAGIKMWELSTVDNSNLEGAPLGRDMMVASVVN
ncbi:hypothetical protein QJQ45_024542 [Haematococcus lacustris]|nr:hypothetical protein QJQ45_024542 [Haematococcus lacustris]